MERQKLNMQIILNNDSKQTVDEKKQRKIYKNVLGEGFKRKILSLKKLKVMKHAGVFTNTFVVY